MFCFQSWKSSSYETRSLVDNYEHETEYKKQLPEDTKEQKAGRLGWKEKVKTWKKVMIPSVSSYGFWLGRSQSVHER